MQTITKIANGILIFFGVFCVLVLVISFNKGTPQDYTLLARVVLISGFVASIFSLKLSSAIKTKLATLVVSTAIALFAAEFVLHATRNSGKDNLTLRAELANAQGLHYDFRSRMDVVLDLRNEGIDAYPGTVAGELLADAPRNEDGEQLYALALKSDSVSVGANESGKMIVYQTDEHGFNNPLGIWRENKIDIVSIGDSFTAAITVEANQNPTAIIRQVYPNTLNLGVSHYGPISELAVMKEYLEELKPNTVLWFYSEQNDLYDLPEEQNTPRLMRYLESDYTQGLIFKQEYIDAGIKAKVQNAIDLHQGILNRWGGIGARLTLREIRGRINNLSHQKGPVSCPPASLISVYEQVLVDAKSFVDSWDGDLYLVYLPFWMRYAQPKEACTYDGDILLHDTVIELAESVGLITIDLTRDFNALPDPLIAWPFGLNGHYSQEGYRLVADRVLKELESR